MIYSWLLDATLIGMNWATPCGDMLSNFLRCDTAFMSTGRHPPEVSSFLLQAAVGATATSYKGKQDHTKPKLVGVIKVKEECVLKHIMLPDRRTTTTACAVTV